MEAVIDLQFLSARAEAMETWFRDEVLVTSTLIQILVIASACFVAWLPTPRLRQWLRLRAEQASPGSARRLLLTNMQSLALPIIWLVLLWTGVIVAAESGWGHEVIKLVASLLTAWVVIRVTATLVQDTVWSRTIVVVVWSIAALNILDLLDPTLRILDSLGFRLGDFRVSALGVIKGVLALTVLLWLANALSRVLERRISALPNLTPSIQVLSSKLLKIALITVAIIAALDSVGIDLSVFALFGGAIGVGLGFGLQKVVSNLISGIILLLDKSIKPGDVIAVGDRYGWIVSLGARYVSVTTRDGIEHLIPNEDLITQRVENWSYSNNLLRLKAPIGVSYKSDVRLARDLCLEAAAETERVLAEPRPICLLTEFGDSSVNLEVRFWINDAQNGISNVKSAVLFQIWDKFHEHGVEIPFPQRDLHLKTPPELRVLARDATDGDTSAGVS